VGFSDVQRLKVEKEKRMKRTKKDNKDNISSKWVNEWVMKKIPAKSSPVPMFL